MLSFLLSLVFSYELNSSIQIGDEVYWTGVTPLGGFSQDASGVVMHIGSVALIDTATNTITILSYHVDGDGLPLENIVPPVGAFISFAKNKIVNNNDLTGYYASINFINNSREKAELFSIGSGVSESSK
tara:strand:- start:6272 stop:6658 length:387 start_codon:yes stop_codon:yes gene_type:complete